MPASRINDRAQDLVAGDILLSHSGRKIVIDNIKYESADTMVYNLTVENVRNYAVQKDGVLVHNVKP